MKIRAASLSHRADAVARRIEVATEALSIVGNLNEMLAMPAEFQPIMKSKRRPIQEHFGSALFPIAPGFDTGFGPVTIQHLAESLIERQQVEATGTRARIHLLRMRPLHFGPKRRRSASANTSTIRSAATRFAV